MTQEDWERLLATSEDPSDFLVAADWYEDQGCQDLAQQTRVKAEFWQWIKDNKIEPSQRTWTVTSKHFFIVRKSSNLALFIQGEVPDDVFKHLPIPKHYTIYRKEKRKDMMYDLFVAWKKWRKYE